MTSCVASRDGDSGEMRSRIDSTRNLCEECSEIENPGSAAQLEAELAAGCRYCGKKCGESICPRCRKELLRITQLKGVNFNEEKRTREELTRLGTLMNEVLEHMAKWVAERGPDDADEVDVADGYQLPDDSTFEELAAADERFTVEAYRFVHRAARAALAGATAEPGEHVSGRDVALAFRSLASQELGTSALPALHGWGLHSTDDIGTLVFRMIEFGILSSCPEDRPEDFHALYDFAAAFPAALGGEGDAH